LIKEKLVIFWFSRKTQFFAENRRHEVAPLDRVTTLCQFSPIGQLITWVSFSKNTEAAQIRGATFSHGKICVLILTKNGFGYILGEFFTN
jgi:hypothetical protein